MNYCELEKLAKLAQSVIGESSLEIKVMNVEHVCQRLLNSSAAMAAQTKKIYSSMR